jgi:uncharacterized protein YmfQ (DUF2313 family)
MSRTPDLVLSCVFMLQPSGWALPAAPDSTWAEFLAPMCAAWSTVEAQAEQFATEIDPRTAVALLPDWLTLVGNGCCTPDPGALSFSNQQRYAYQRLTSRGGQSIAYFTALAAAMGVDITIQEGVWSFAGAMQAGMCCGEVGNQFNWQVTLPSTLVSLFIAGGSEAGDPLGGFAQNLVQCPITTNKPAHTNVGFVYVVPPGAIELEDGDGAIATEDGGEILLEASS